MSERFLLPVGLKDYRTQDVKKIDFVSSIFLDEAEVWGYKKILTPIFEKLDSLEVGTKQEEVPNIIKFIDPLNGDVLGIRSDVTPQIARYIATNYKEESSPFRLCYIERVVRNQSKDIRNKREIFQVGCELIGSDEIESDLEIILLPSRILNKLGFDRQTITLNSSLFLNFIFSKLPTVKEKIAPLFHKKDFDSIKKFLKDRKLPKKEGDFLKNYVVPLISQKSVNIKGLPANVQNELKKVEFLSDSLKSLNPNLNVAIDLLDVKDFSYYSNITFDIAIPGANQIVVSGGRYNELIKKYGKNLPAIGFGINILPLLAKIDYKDLGIPVVVIEHLIPKNLSLSFEARDFFNSQGFVCILSNQKNQYKGEFDIRVKVNNNQSIDLYNKSNKKTGNYKTLSQLKEEEL